MAPRLKRAFERARQRTDQLAQPSVTAAVLLDSVLAENGLAAEILVLMDVDVGQVRWALDS